MTPPFLLLIFILYDFRSILGEKNIWIVEVVLLILDLNGMKLCIWNDRGVWDNVKNVHFSYKFFATSGSSKSFYWKVVSWTNKKARGFSEIHSFCKIIWIFLTVQVSNILCTTRKRYLELRAHNAKTSSVTPSFYCSFSKWLSSKIIIWLSVVPSLKKIPDSTSFSMESPQHE